MMREFVQNGLSSFLPVVYLGRLHVTVYARLERPGAIISSPRSPRTMEPRCQAALILSSGPRHKFFAWDTSTPPTCRLARPLPKQAYASRKPQEQKPRHKAKKTPSADSSSPDATV